MSTAEPTNCCRWTSMATTMKMAMSYRYSYTVETDWHSNNYCYDDVADDDCLLMHRCHWAMWPTLPIFLVVLCAMSWASRSREDGISRSIDCCASCRPATLDLSMNLQCKLFNEIDLLSNQRLFAYQVLELNDR